MSLIASFTSAATPLGLPSTVYFEGIIGIWTSKTSQNNLDLNDNKYMKYQILVLGYILCTVITAHVFIPIYHGLKLSSSYEVTEFYSVFRCSTKQSINDFLFLVFGI